MRPEPIKLQCDLSRIPIICFCAGSQARRQRVGVIAMERQMSQPTIFGKSKWRWIPHAATFIAALLGTCIVTASAHSADLYHYETYPAPQYQPPPNYYYTGTNCPSCGCGQCGCAPCGCAQCGCGQCGCGPCAVSLPPPRVVVERRTIMKQEYIERRYMDDCCQEQSYGYPPSRPHPVPSMYPSAYGQPQQFPWGYGGVRGQTPPGYYR